MITEIHFPEDLPANDRSTVKVAIVYEDFSSGTRAKHFAEQLAEQLGCACEFADSLWRLELLDNPVIAGEAARAAAECDYLIVSLRGDGVLPFATRHWIEAQLDGAAARGAWVIALLGSDRGKRQVLDGNRRYLRSVCAAKGVEFFSMAADPSAESSATNPRDQREAAGFEPPGQPPTLTLRQA